MDIDTYPSISTRIYSSSPELEHDVIDVVSVTLVVILSTKSDFSREPVGFGGGGGVHVIT